MLYQVRLRVDSPAPMVQMDCAQTTPICTGIAIGGTP